MPIAVMEGWYEYGEGHMELDEETGRLHLLGILRHRTEANMMPERVADELRATRYISMRLLDAREGVVLTFQAVTLDVTIGEITQEVDFQLYPSTEPLINFGIGAVATFGLSFAANGSVFQTIDSQPPKPLRAYCAGTVTYPRQDPGRDESTPPVEEPKERTTKRAREEEETERAPPRKICVTEKPHKRTDGVFVTPPNPSSNGAVEEMNRTIRKRLRPTTAGGAELTCHHQFPGTPICPVFPQRAEDQLSEWAGMRFNDHAEPMAT
ncbi:hypothetical protein TYRP_020148 [Tyrophagus putrescentiae]|nr:hypothetical protein TYRP_020148 [Tyrophagus putrescentiae]